MAQRLKIAAIIVIVLGVIGLVDSSYLVFKHYSDTIPPCTIKGCEVVLTSEYSEIFGIPVALFGTVYYLTILILITAYLASKKEEIIKLAATFTPFGLVASIYFVYIQLFVIKAICQYCMLSAGTSTILFIVGIYVLLEINKKSIQKEGR